MQSLKGPTEAIRINVNIREAYTTNAETPMISVRMINCEAQSFLWSAIEEFKHEHQAGT